MMSANEEYEVTVLQLLHSSDPILHEGTPVFDFDNPSEDPIQLAKDLAETMIFNHGLGLAAPQVGVAVRAIAITGEPIYVMFNPMVVDTSSEMCYIKEGCLSYPGLTIKIRRPRMIKVRFTMPNGQTETMKFDGLSARCILHEIDHLDGICHIDRATYYHRQQALKEQKAFSEIMKRSKK